MKCIFPLFLALIVSSHTLSAQKDVEFWFVAPNILDNTVQNYDRPTAFRFSTYEQNAVITIFQPANPAFPVQTLNVPAHSTSTLEFPPSFNHVENYPNNTVLNRGFLIRSTAPISVYYEIIGGCICNPEIFSLKGRNALGTNFYVPFQMLLDNAGPSNRTASIDIVATEPNTNISITPAKDLVGHPAGVSFSITLNTGQTYSCEAESLLAGEHPSGTLVVSDKPIAITMKDDLLEGGTVYGGSCRDVVGDQLIPVDKLGKTYVVSKGFLNGEEIAFVVGTANNTSVRQDGVEVAVIDAGETIGLPVYTHHFIESSEPVYVLQLTGIGCEVAGEFLPSLDCTGSTEVRFVRTTSEPFYLFLTARTDLTDDFLLNGSNLFIHSTDFSEVPGSNGAWSATVLEFDTGVIPTNSSISIKNTNGVFHMGILNGQVTATGARFGFFSDFGKTTFLVDSTRFCEGDTVYFRGAPIATEGTFFDTITTPEGCDTIYEFRTSFLEFIYTAASSFHCAGDTVVFSNQPVFYTQTLVDTIQIAAGCDTIIQHSFFFSDFIEKNQAITFCEGDAVNVYGDLFYDSGVVIDTIDGFPDCDTIVTTILTTTPLPNINRTIILCPGETVVINGETQYLPGIYTDTLRSLTTCDTIRYNSLVLAEEDGAFLSPDTSICEGETIRLFSLFPETEWSDGSTGNYIDITDAGLYQAKYITVDSCVITDSIWVEICCFDRGLYIPNAFKPSDNGGVNSIFKPFATPSCSDFRFQVWSRWGALIFESDNPDDGWDGTVRGKPAPVDVYVWVLEFTPRESGKRLIRKGDVTLIR